MATTRSTLLEGLEDISEEEQLMLLLEISKEEAGSETQGHQLSDEEEGEEEEEEEEYKKAIEISKKEKEEEETIRAIMQSLSQSERNVAADDNIASRIPECPVCYERFTGQSQVFQCQQGHFLCGSCGPRTHICPTCRGTMIGRCNGFEQFLQSLNF